MKLPFVVFTLSLLLLLSHANVCSAKIIFITDGASMEAEGEGEPEGERDGEVEREGEGEGGSAGLARVSAETDSSGNQHVTISHLEQVNAAKLEQAPWKEFGEDMEEYVEQGPELKLKRELEPDPGSWKQILDAPIRPTLPEESLNSSQLYALGVQRMFGVKYVPKNIPLAIKALKKSAELGFPHAQSTLGFLFASGYGMSLSDVKAFLYHNFAASGGSYESKMALAYSFLRQQEYEHAANLYAKVAAKAVLTYHIVGGAPIVETVRLNSGAEENIEAVKGHRGEDDETIQFVANQAAKGNVDSMRTLGILYYLGARGIQQNPTKAFEYFRQASEKSDPISIVNLGEMYARGVGVEQDYGKALEWFYYGTELEIPAAYSALGYLYARGSGVRQNYTKALELFTKAAKKYDVDGQYYLGVMNYHGLGLKRNVQTALTYFKRAGNRDHLSHLAAVYQVAKMNQKGIGTRQNFQDAATLFKAVAERGPWGVLLRWAHENYMAGEIPTALLLYSRAAELGYEVAQSNAAWLLNKFQDKSGCVGESGTSCSDEERHERAHRLWRHASEQGNVQAALSIGDAYFYGRGTKKDLERAVEAYRRASERRSAQALFHLAFMHEHGLGLPADPHLAKRFYDDALVADKYAVLAVKLALFGLWLRRQKRYRFVMKFVDSLPELIPELVQSAKSAIQDQGNLAVGVLIALLLVVLHIRQRRRRPPM